MKNVDIHTHLNAPMLRIDLWNTLAEVANSIYYTHNSMEITKLEKEIQDCLDLLKIIEHYHAFPGIILCNRLENLLFKNEFGKFHELISLIVQALRSPTANYKNILKILQSEEINREEFIRNTGNDSLHYFEILMVDDLPETNKKIIKQEMDSYAIADEKFIYEIVFVNSFEDALIAIMFNFNIKCCLISDLFKFSSDSELPIFKNLLRQANIMGNLEDQPRSNHAIDLAASIRRLRQKEIDIYYLSSHDPEKSAAYRANIFNKIFYDFENHYESHLTIIQGIKNHYETPFFDSLKKYTFEPKSSFHALPVARGKSVFNSRWIQDMQDFYGRNIFLAESSATAGGLDSLMHPIGSIKRAMEKASDYFGSHQTFFVTDGTSAANKVVLQTLLKPGDIVLIEHSCHESHHYGIIMNGAHPIYLNGYSLSDCDISGPVPLQTIKKELLNLKHENKLQKVKLIILTNCTFDGIVYNVQKYMEEILAIKPDMIFFWDEAWFAYARCVPHYRLRTAMYSATTLENKYKSLKYQEEYKLFKELAEKHNFSDGFMLKNALLPDPEKVKIRVYCTQSTHKSLSCLRQGSMIHVFDHKFDKIKERFAHAFMSFSTTSPNYQILATMDLARRQADLEGFELVQHAIELAMIFRQQVNNHKLISRYFVANGPSELIPEQFRQSKVVSGYEPSRDWETVEKAWLMDDFVIDPTRVTLKIKSNINGFQMKKILMDKFGIQVNKVSLNSILLQFNIGTLRSSVSYLLDSLCSLAKEFERRKVSGTVRKKLPEPPNFTQFSGEFLAYHNLPAGHLRKAYYATYDNSLVEYKKIRELKKLLKAGEKIVSAAIIIPYPPGYPALVPGQIITESILEYLSCVDLSSILGGDVAKDGIKIFKK